MKENEYDNRKAVLVYVYKDKEDPTILEELAMLSNSADYDVVATMTQHKDVPDKSFYIGSGKLEELKLVVKEQQADVVIFDNNLSGSQFNNLEKQIGVDVIDRATVILEIFAKHATTNEGKIQVELARKKHALPRVLGQGAFLSRQGGGGGGGMGARRGGGEQQSELDKRTIRREIRDLEEKNRKIAESRKLRRNLRDKNNIKKVCIVGYTNAGKSTLMNRLTKANVLADDKLFATLDPVTKKMWLAPKKEFIITDTVGFISRLPHEFIDAFGSTLEETAYADLILHVCNGADPEMMKQYDVVCEVLNKIGAAEIPAITVINKCDAGQPIVCPEGTDTVFVSAQTGDGLESLKEKISFALFNETFIWE